jgi:4-hydroxy-tetrahydrodipicolinate synthase
MAVLQVSGTYTAIVTPFGEDYSIDFDAFRELINYQIDNGVEGIVVCGSTGESATLTAKEKLALIIDAVDQAKGRVPIIAGTGSNDTSASIDLTRMAKEHGAASVLLVAPYYNKPTQEGLYYHYKTIAMACDIPQIIYNVPSRSGVNIQAEIVLRLAKEFPNIIAVKEASGNMDQVMEIMRKRPKGFAVLSGEDSLTVPLISMGADGVIGVTPNYAPKEFSEMTRQALKGNIATARRLHFKLFELMQLNMIETNPTPVKAMLSIMGKIKAVYRQPLLPIHEDNLKKLTRALKRAKLL